ncbi:DUF6318 family protein [Georgenia alba]|uniref:DUF6318 family protein n=1 Tax=Georgenia alba TaxID=2233858 RepID=A0ABW2Q9N8_9MICO
MTQGVSGRRRLAAVGAAALVVAGLAACDGASGEPTETPSETESATQTGSPTPEETPSAPESPTPDSRIEVEDVGGAIAAAEYFLELYTYSRATGDLSAWREMSDPECNFCSNIAENTESRYSSGGHIEGGEMTIERTSGTAPTDSSPYFGVDAHIVEGVSEHYSPDEAEPEVLPAVRHVMVMALQYEDGRWIIRGVEVLSSEEVEGGN